MRLAVFVTPHGFGHAARSCAVVSELLRLEPDLEPVFYTTVPTWFLAESLGRPVEVRPVTVDVGVCQQSPTEEDLPATLDAVDTLLASADELGACLGEELRRSGCRGVLADIAPLGMLAAERGGMPAILLQSFSWPWIYQGLSPRHPPLAGLADRFARCFPAPRHVLELTPSCAPVAGAHAVPPVARAPREPELARHRLGLDPGRPLVVVSFGGIAADLATLVPHLRSASASAASYVLLGGGRPGEDPRREDNVLLLGQRSPVYHPDLVAAADVLVSKLGYGTVTEAWHHGTRLLFADRPGFPESAVLRRFAEDTLPAQALADSPLACGAALPHAVERLLEVPRGPRREATGATVAASQILDWLA